MDVEVRVEDVRTSTEDREGTKENVHLQPRMLAKKSCSGLNKRILKEHAYSNLESSSTSPGNYSGNSNEGCRSPRASIPSTSSHPPSQNGSVAGAEVSPKNPRSVAKKSCSRSHVNKKHNRELSTRKKSGGVDATLKRSSSYGVSHKSKNIKITTKRKPKKVNKTRAKVYPKPPFVRAYSSPTEEVTRAMEEMADELLRDSPCIDFLKTKMWESFPYRKHFYENKPNIGIVFEIFPALRDWRILKRDFELFQRASFEELDEKLKVELDENFQKYEMQCRSWTEPLLQRVFALADSTEDAIIVRDLKLLCFAYIKGGKKGTRGTLYKEHPKDQPAFRLATPTIDVSGEYGSCGVEITVYCERRRIVTAPNFYEAVMCVYSLHWIFNLCYEKHCQPFFESFDLLIGD